MSRTHPVSYRVSYLLTDLIAIANRLDRLAPSHRDPHKYHAEKRALVQALRKIAREVKT